MFVGDVVECKCPRGKGELGIAPSLERLSTGMDFSIRKIRGSSSVNGKEVGDISNWLELISSHGRW